MLCERKLISNYKPRNVKNIEKHEHGFGKSHAMFTFLIFSEVYYHLCNNRCGGVNGRLNCQTESKISAADKMGGGKLNPTMKKNFLSQILWNTSKKLFFFYFLFFIFMKARMGGQLKRSQKVQLCICLLEYGFLSLY